MKEGPWPSEQGYLSGTRCEHFALSALYYLIAIRDQVVLARIRVIPSSQIHPSPYFSQVYFSEFRQGGVEVREVFPRNM